MTFLLSKMQYTCVFKWFMHTQKSTRNDETKKVMKKVICSMPMCENKCILCALKKTKKGYIPVYSMNTKKENVSYALASGIYSFQSR